MKEKKCTYTHWPSLLPQGLCDFSYEICSLSANFPRTSKLTLLLKTHHLSAEVCRFPCLFSCTFSCTWCNAGNTQHQTLKIVRVNVFGM